MVDTTVICINPDAAAEEPYCSTVSPQFNTTDVRPMPNAGPRKGIQKEKKKILRALPVRKKLAEEEAEKVNDKAKKLFDRKRDNSKQDAKLRKKPERNVHR